jgi:rubrerythrin
MNDLLEILKLAKEKEMVRKAAYAEAAAAATNPLVKHTFAALAKEEDKHAGYVQAYYDKQVANEGWPAPAAMGVTDDFEAVIAEIFKAASAQIKATGAQPQAELTEAYEAAIAAEEESIAFYAGALDKASDPNARAFFQILVKMEKLHLRLVTDTQLYLDDPIMWNFEEEQWIVEG